MDVLRFFHPVLPLERLGRTPVRVVVDGTPIVLYRDGGGRPAALSDRCPHRFAPLSAGRVRPDGRLACGYHGWHFDRDGAGTSPAQPDLRCRVEAYRVVERYGYAWVASAAAESDGPVALGRDGFSFAGAFATRFAAPLHVALDNFCEDEHTPFVHHFLGWREEAAAAVEFSCTVHDDRTEVRYAAAQRPSPWLPLLFLRPGDLFENDWVTRFQPIHTVYHIHWRSRASGRARPVEALIPIFFVPETPTTTWLHSFAFAKLNAPYLGLLWPLVRWAAMRVARNEVEDDARWIPTVADTPLQMRGMRLGRFDKPLAANRPLVRRLYRGEEAEVAAPASSEPCATLPSP